MPRKVTEWVGKTDNSMPPPSVRLRIFRTHKGICHLSGLKITPRDKWELDHIVPLWDGGENRETNLAPALFVKHKEKSAKDQTAQALRDRKQKKMFGITERSSWSNTYKGRPVKKRFDGSVIDKETGEQLWP